jgi:leucyl/phenylalanyl-tRNA--protein transferase
MIPFLEKNAPFPPVSQALGEDSDYPGLLAASEDLTPQRLLTAYENGIFPWYSGDEPVLWWSTDPRMVLFLDEFKLSKSLRKAQAQFLNTPNCEIRMDTAFAQVMQACAQSPRPGQNGTWITPAIIAAYTTLHQQGFAHSVELWRENNLVGGLYGVQIGCMFYGESMFARETNASKIALAHLVAKLQAQGGLCGVWCVEKSDGAALRRRAGI